MLKILWKLLKILSISCIDWSCNNTDLNINDCIIQNIMEMKNANTAMLVSRNQIIIPSIHIRSQSDIFQIRWHISRTYCSDLLSNEKQCQDECHKKTEDFQIKSVQIIEIFNFQMWIFLMYSFVFSNVWKFYKINFQCQEQTIFLLIYYIFSHEWADKVIFENLVYYWNTIYTDKYLADNSDVSPKILEHRFRK